MYPLLFALLLLTGDEAHGGIFSFNDDFSTYAEGSDGGPVWQPLSIRWEVRDGRYVGSGVWRSFSAVGDAPYASRLQMEATVTIGGKTGSGWKVAGISVFRDRRNYWHLALVESPDSLGAGHFFELHEMLGDVWLAQTKPGTFLKGVMIPGG